MSAFTTAQAYAIKENIAEMCRKVLAHQAQDLALTHDNVLDLFVPPEHHHALKGIREVGHVYCYDAFSADWPATSTELTGITGGHQDITLSIRFLGNDFPCAPLKPKLQSSDSALALASRLNAWLAERIRIGFEFGRVALVLSMLDEMCVNPRQLRFLWPTISSLVTGDTLQALRVKLEAGGPPPAHIPPIRPLLRSAMEHTAGIVAGVALLSGAPPERRDATVDIASGLFLMEPLGRVAMLK
jgi:hypothetical protein